VKMCSVARLCGRGVFVACLIIAFLSASVELSRISAASEAPANSQDVVEAARFVLEDILNIDLSKYPLEVKSVTTGTYMGLPEESIVFTFESGGEFVDFSFSFVNGRLRSLTAHATEGLLPLLSVKSEFDMVKKFLERCREHFGTVYYESMRDMLEGLSAKENATVFSGNIKLTAIHGKIRDLNDRLVDFAQYRWTYVVDGAEAPLKCVALHFERGSFSYFIDMWSIYKIGCDKIQISKEEAVKIAIEKVQNASFKVYAGNGSWIEVKGFKVEGVNWTNIIFTNYPSGGGARGGDSLTLYPVWRINVYFDKLYPGNIYGASVAIWADTGEVCEIRPLYIMGSMLDNEALSSESSNFNAEVIQIVPVTEEQHDTSLHQVPWLTAVFRTLWVRELGVLGLGGTHSLIQTFDGGFAVVGGKDGGFLLMKLDGEGNVEWERTYGTEAEFESFANDVLQTDDGGFLLAGRGDPFPNFIGPNGTLFNLVKVDAYGNVEWTRSYGTRTIEAPFVAYSIVKSSRGGYVIAGYSEVGWTPIASGSGKVVLIKITEHGNVEWRREFPLGTTPFMWSAVYLVEADDGYALLTVVRSRNGDEDFLLIKIDWEGNKLWEKRYNCSRHDIPRALVRASDGGFLLAGWAFIHGNEFNCSVIKVDEEGHVEWARDYGARVNSAATSKDGGYLLALSSSSGGSILKIDAEGNVQWAVRYEGGDQPAIIPYHVVETADGAYVFAGVKADNPEVNVLVKFKPTSHEEPTAPPATIMAVAAAAFSMLLAAIIIHLRKRRR